MLDFDHFRLMKRLLILPVAALAFTAHGQARAVDLKCFANFRIDFEPMRTEKSGPGSADIDSEFFNCLSPSGKYPELSSAELTKDGGVSVVGCLTLTLTTSGSEFTWNMNPNQTSTFNGNVNLNIKAGSVGFSALFTQGELAGYSANAVPIAPFLDGTCLTGLKSLGANFAEVFFLR